MPTNPPTPPPLLFRLARGLIRRRIRGGYRLIEWLERSGRLNRSAVYALSDRIAVELPLWRRPNQLDAVEARNYEQALVAAVARELEALNLPTLLIDCGADVGLLAGLLIAQTKSIAELIAFEPNAEAYEVLLRNLARWPLPSRGRHEAVADFTGRGKLCQPEYDGSPHAAFLQANPLGKVQVTRIDDLRFDVAERCLLLKVDVEGGEQAVVQGALETLGRARSWVVTIEAHRQVALRTGIDPFEVVRLLDAVGVDRVYLAEWPELKLDRTGRYFDQVSEPAIGNLVCVSTLG